MTQNVADLFKSVAYLVAVGVLLGLLARGATAAMRSLHDTPLAEWVVTQRQARQSEQTRISTVVANAREIREALARPIPGPDPLPPITAKLAYGHLKPGGKGHMAAARLNSKIPKSGMDAMAMGAPSHLRASSTVAPEIHKVY